jgi:hypothetical protein
MRLTDFCILFAGLFLCLFLGRDLQIASLLAQELSEVSYNRQMDRIAEDALMDVVETEETDGTLRVRTEQLAEQYGRLMGSMYELTEEEKQMGILEAVTLWEFRQYPYNLSAGELEQIRAGLESQLREEKRRRREQQLLSLAMPYTYREDYYQTLAGPQLFTVFDPREFLPGVDRVMDSGSRIIKLPDQKLVIVK